MRFVRQKPAHKPLNPLFSSGPCAKRPGWSLDALKDAPLGRSHRSSLGKAKLREVIDLTRLILGIPDDYCIGIVPASDTGAMEIALWSLLGQRGVDMLAWESFGKEWVSDVGQQLKLPDVRSFIAPYGELPDLSMADFDRDVVFTWNGTTSGVRVPNGDWIPDDRGGLAICDATSAAFAMNLPWHKLDVATWSWQKVLGGEGAHGMLVLSPRALHRLDSYQPDRPIPKIFRLTRNGKFISSIFEGDTINTPSMLCVEDAIDGLRWAHSIGGLAELVQRSERNLSIVANWAGTSGWADFLARDPATRSSTSICLEFVAPDIAKLPWDKQLAFADKLTGLLEQEGVAFDIRSYRDAPPGLRLWSGATVENSNMAALLPWLDWAFNTALER